MSGFPFDWSYLHMSVAGDELSGPLTQREHRLLYTFLRRHQLSRVGVSAPDLMQATKHIDWDVPLGAPMADGAYPAKFNLNMPGETPTCQDFVVYGLNTPGTTGGQPNLVGLTNLYSGTVGGTGLCNTDPGVYQDIFWTWVYAATVKFAYNGSTMGGAITNSVVMSESGLKVAYVESTGTASAFHVVTLPAGNGTGTLASAVTGAAASATVPPAIATIPSSGSWAAGDSYSSVWVDYTNDLAYVGTNDGSLHKIQNVFCTTPACLALPVAPSEVTAPGIWPVALAGAGALTSPVQDANGVIYVEGAATGKLYAVTAAGLVTTSTQSFMPNSVVDGPMLDVDGNGTTQALYWFSNSQSAVSSPSVQQPQMVQTNSALTVFNNYSLLLNGTAEWGVNSMSAVPVHAGTFDNAFYSNRNGNMWACGWWQNGQYSGNHLGVVRFGINGTTVTPDTSKVYSQLSPDWIAAVNTCSPVTEALDSSGNDHIFVSSRYGYQLSAGTCINQASCISGYSIASSGSPAAYSLNVTGSYALNSVGNSSGGYNNYTSGIIVDNNVNPASSTCGPSGNQSCAQASSIYFTYGNDAIKLTQAQLQ